jgi:hypothetical protein
LEQRFILVFAQNIFRAQPPDDVQRKFIVAIYSVIVKSEKTYLKGLSAALKNGENLILISSGRDVEAREVRVSM